MSARDFAHGGKFNPTRDQVRAVSDVVKPYTREPETWKEHARTCTQCGEFQGVPCPFGSRLLAEETERRSKRSGRDAPNGGKDG